MLDYLLELFMNSQDPMKFCAGQPVILYSSFEDLANHINELPEIDKSYEEVLFIFQEQTKRFSACGGNNSDPLSGVLRKNPDTGWKYLADLIIN